MLRFVFSLKYSHLRVTHRRFSTILTTLILALSLLACGGSSSDSTSPNNGNDSNGDSADFDHAAVLKNYAAIMETGFATTATRVDSLHSAVVNYCDALGSGEEQTQYESAQQAFLSAMEAVQKSLLHSIGPALELDRLVQLYSWPLQSTCQIDLKLASNLTELNLAVNKRGLDALEYLLFADPAAPHTCPQTTVPNPPDLLDNYDALPLAEKKSRRCDFMLNVASDARKSANILADAWNSEKGNYGATLSGAENPVEAINEVTDAMFYFEKVLKENKLDQPLGGNVTNTLPSCGAGQPCPQDVESAYARISKENLIANVQAFQTLYLGGPASESNALGLDDWLIAEGESGLASEFAAAIQSVLDALNAMDGSLYELIETDVNSVNSLLLGPVQDVSVPLRANILQVLGLRLPKGSESDTD